MKSGSCRRLATKEDLYELWMEAILFNTRYWLNMCIPVLKTVEYLRKHESDMLEGIR